MCGRYDTTGTRALLPVTYQLDGLPDYPENPDARPTQPLPIVRLTEAGQRECVLARWGLIPSWAKDVTIGASCINARSETVADKPAFRAAMKRRHCLVPAAAFYEWHAEPGQPRKTRYRISSPDGDLLSLAGLWEWWPGQSAQPGVTSFTLITTVANALLAPIHDRMPVLLDPAYFDWWLDASQDGRALLQPAPDRWLQLVRCEAR